MASVGLSSVYIGHVGHTGVYRFDLSQGGLAAIESITILDDQFISGGSGAVSGLDLDFVKLSSTATTDAASVMSLDNENAFNFGREGVVFQPGFLQSWSPGDDPAWNVPYLSGTNANAYSPEKTTLGVLDQTTPELPGAMSIGEGGKITFLLNYALQTGQKYLYVGERGGGNDKFFVTASNQPASGAPAQISNDVHLIGTPRNDRIMLGEGLNQHLGAGNDTIEGREGHDRLGAAAGDDLIVGSDGNDTIYGGSGNDRVHGGVDNDRVYGGSGNDKVFGGTGHDRVYGGSGNDKIYGENGNDRIFGGSGNDTLYGRRGEDVFVSNTKLGTSRTDRSFNFDKIADYGVMNDDIWLDNAIFRKLGGGSSNAPKQLDENFFTIGAAAQDANDYLIYNSNTGVLSYDSDGSGSKAAVEFAQLRKGLAMTFKDFFVI